MEGFAKVFFILTVFLGALTMKVTEARILKSSEEVVQPQNLGLRAPGFPEILPSPFPPGFPLTFPSPGLPGIFPSPTFGLRAPGFPEILPSPFPPRFPLNFPSPGLPGIFPSPGLGFGSLCSFLRIFCPPPQPISPTGSTEVGAGVSGSP